ENPVFCILVDSYYHKDINIVEKILEEKKIKGIDIICWTHPHKDHSKGMKNIIEYYSDENTWIIIPEGIELSSHDFSKDAIELFEYLKKQVKQSTEKYKVMSISDYKDILFYYRSEPKFIYQAKEFLLKMSSFSPPSNCLRENLILDQFDNNLNSIGFVLVLGNKYLVFTGDIENKAWNQLSRMFDNEIDVFKIPHHGSNTASEALKLVSNIDISVCTSYRCGKSQLPEQKILENYQNISSHVYLTQSLCNEENHKEYGIVKIKYDLLHETYDVKTYGNAREIK
ncbi:hypothetical protein, partial [Dubosiella newyorkensis]